MTWPGGYACAPGLTAALPDYSVRPIRWDDRDPIRHWRNEQVSVLRQRTPLSSADQDAYFTDVVRPQLSEAEPSQVLLGFEYRGALVGYGGVVHISWPNRRGEVSFLSATDRLDDTTFATDWAAWLDLLVPMSRDVLGLHKLTTESYAGRHSLFPLLEAAGFVREGTLREQYRVDDEWTDTVMHGLILEP